MSDGTHGPSSTEVTSRLERVRVVALGASAGGLAALRTFFESLPASNGAVYVVVQHLDPTHGSLLAGLLQSTTDLPVVDAVDGQPLTADCVVVIPPGFVAQVDSGCLHLTPRLPANAGRTPIDHFFRSLAAAMGADGVGVVLSGTGTDGTLGLAALQSVGALTLAQVPESAEFDGMPQSAIAAGVVDVVDTPDNLARAVAARVATEDPDMLGRSVETFDLSAVLSLLRDRTGQDFSGYKVATLRRRLGRRLALHQITSVTDYLRLLRDDPLEIERLSRDLHIGVTSFFRDQAVWRTLVNEVLPSLFEGRDPDAELRAWVAGCSTGEEAYSLAMGYLEARERWEENGAKRAPGLRIFATDVEPAAIDHARRGVYPVEVVVDLGEERFARWFTHAGGQARILQRIRDMMIFAVHDAVNDPPFTRLDLATCRNLLIYLEPALQQRLLSTLHHSLEPDGVLVLGMAEGTGQAPELFASVSEGLRIYRSRANPSARPPLGFRSVPAIARHLVQPTSVESRLELHLLRTLVARFAPPSVLTDERGDLLYVSGRTRDILEAPTGRVNWNLLALMPDHLRWTIGQALRSVVETGGPVDLDGLRFDSSNSHAVYDVNLSLLRGGPPEPRRVVVTFCRRVDAVAPVEPTTTQESGVGVPNEPFVTTELARMHQELQAAYAELHASSEQQESMNEELQTANEQLQSTNEELMVSIEEVQSMNEELQTLNQELQARVDELVTASDDMGNLLNSTEIATVFLDANMNVRRFTPHVTDVITLRPVDLGRPVSEISSALQYPELVPDALRVLRTSASHDVDVPTTDGRWFAVRLLPYRTHDDRLDGVVITFRDITAAKALEVELRRAQAAGAGGVIVDD